MGCKYHHTEAATKNIIITGIVNYKLVYDVKCDIQWKENTGTLSVKRK